MKRIPGVLLFLFLLGSWSLMSGGQAARTDEIDQDYVLALSSANRFLSSWQSRDMEEGLKWLSLSLKHRKPSEELVNYISGTSNPHHQAFEVGGGKRTGEKSFAFEVRLYEHYTDTKWERPRPQPSRIVLIEEQPGRWRVDELP